METGFGFGLFAGMALLVLVMFVLALGLTVFWIWMLVDCATKETAEGNLKLVWILIIIFTGWIGALVYFFARRQDRVRQQGA